MTHLLIEHKEDVLNVLNLFFEKKYSRFANISKPPWALPHIFEFARSIYKRGPLPVSPINLSSNFSFLKKTQLLSLLAETYHTSSFFICDSGFLTHHSEFMSCVKSSSSFFYTPQESSKNIDTVIEIIQKIPLTTKEIVALGGGITLDVAAFVAALLHIQIRVVPTTLLSTIDACLGGKNGVNFPPYGKNQVGVFYPIQHQYIVSELFYSLSPLDIYSGLTEAIKHLWLWGEFNAYEKEIMPIFDSPQHIDFLCSSTFLNLNLTIKAHVVEQDPYETQNIRSCLNLGHTIAHVIEALAEQGIIDFIPHGIAVAHGFRFLFREHLLSCPIETLQDTIEKICRVQEIKQKSDIKRQDIEALLTHDKKNQSASHLCFLSLPHYGFLKSPPPLNSPLQPFSVSEISSKILNYLSFT